MGYSGSSKTDRHEESFLNAMENGKQSIPVSGYGNKAVAVSKGGRNTKIHASVDGLGNPLAFLLSPVTTMSPGMPSLRLKKV